METNYNNNFDADFVEQMPYKSGINYNADKSLECEIDISLKIKKLVIPKLKAPEIDSVKKIIEGALYDLIQEMRTNKTEIKLKEFLDYIDNQRTKERLS